ncbi:MAG: response regulator [Aliidongia sp.]
MSLNPGGRRSKIVIGVDDEADNLDMLGSLIEGAGFTFIGASSGTECLSLVLRITPRLILLDIEMRPGMDGFETCRRLRKDMRLKPIPIVFLTGRKTGEDVKACIKAGGNDFIVKPFDPVKLVDRVEYWMVRRVAATESQAEQDI